MKRILHSFPRAIVHVDGDSFFAGCEVAKNPSLKGKPVIVGKERGMATALTYEAKSYGLKRGMPVHQILELCPHAIILPSDYETYSLYSKRMFNIVRRYTPVVEEYSIDECFAEITGLRRSLNMSYEKIVGSIKKDLDTELGMTFSVGLAPTKVLAKIASTWKKPSGLTNMSGMQIYSFLEQVPVEKVWGIGSQTAAFLNAHGIRSALQFAYKPEWWVKEWCTKPHYEIWKELNGEVVYECETETKREYGSISKTKTFTPSSKERSRVFAELSKNIENACIKARRHDLVCKEITFFLKTKDFKCVGLEVKLSAPTNIPTDIVGVVIPLFDHVYKKGVLYRSTGIILSKLQSGEVGQLDLFGASVKKEALKEVYSVVDTMSKKYGKHTLFLGSSFKAVKNVAHAGDRGVKAERVNQLFRGEGERKRLGIPMLGEVV